MRRFKNLSILLLFVMFIWGCTEVKEHNKGIEEEDHEIVDGDNSSNETTYHFSYKGQEFKIISFFDEVLEYARTISENPELDKKAIYTEHVLEPFKEQSSINDITLGDPLSPSWEIEQLEKKTNELLENQEQINNWIEEAIMESAELLTGKDTNIYIFPVNPEEWFLINSAEGISGMTFSESNFLLMIDPSVSEEMLKYTVAHEYHHTVNFLHDGVPIYYNILDLIMIEGKADSFASIVYPETKVYLTEPLSDDEEAKVLEEISVNGESMDFSIYNNLVYGNTRKEIPKFSNYKIGYQINESFIDNNPDISILEWTKKSAKEILKGSKYSDLLR
ncbi:hypothetical protein AM499_06800 [Bacillus sp. FJAT-22090]|uniref:DUF2268 domain-containing protein n=1 Tax=Bacillus sp. FJAT-22090 TaxID=1581038 RepID=UPI0006AEC18A|nr:DUF2268 domain-containing putative Zn-dependent protease [Bacillus sp. FJAT-22090]ALC85560.1 hypothetical protein AM499_06800 [Bacillus sp. FJAT-22090]